MALGTMDPAASDGLVERTRTARGASQGDVALAWALSAFIVIAGAVTYARVDPVVLHADTTRHGVSAGLSRVVMAANMPVALIAIAVVLIALEALPLRAWWVGAPAIAMCAFMAWPGVIDDRHMDARVVNLVPAAGVLLAAGLSVAAGRCAGWRMAARRTFDPVRAVLAGVIVVLALPWFAAEMGLYLPGDVFWTGHRVLEGDSRLWPAVHHGYHHGFAGTLLMLSALLLSRPRVISAARRVARRLYVSLMFAYGAVNFANDLWGEQIVKRGWAHWKIPSALFPRLHPIWLVILALAAFVALLLRYEDTRDKPTRDTGSAM